MSGYCPVKMLLDHHRLRIQCLDEPLTLQFLNEFHGLSKQQQRLPTPPYLLLLEMVSYLAAERSSTSSKSDRPILSCCCSLECPSAAVTDCLFLFLQIAPNYLPATLSLRLSLSYLTISEHLLYQLFSACEDLHLISCTSPDLNAPSPLASTSPLRQLRITLSPQLSLLRSSCSPLSLLRFLVQLPHFHLLDLSDSLPKNSQREFSRRAQELGFCVEDPLQGQQEVEEQRRRIVLRGITSPDYQTAVAAGTKDTNLYSATDMSFPHAQVALQQHFSGAEMCEFFSSS